MSKKMVDLKKNLELEKARRVVTTGRGLLEYENRLNFDRLALEGKIILDLGAGVAAFEDELATYFEKSSNKPQVVALDSAYDFQGKGFGKELLDVKIDRIVEKHKENISAVPGLFSDLPFPDNFFDFVFSLYAFPLHIRSEAFLKKGLEEIVRVLKIGGTAKLAPLEYHLSDNEKDYITYRQHHEHFENVFKRVNEKNGNKLTFVTFPSEHTMGLEIKKN